MGSVHSTNSSHHSSWIYARRTHPKEMASARKGIEDMRTRCRIAREQENAEADVVVDTLCAFLYDVIAPLNTDRDVYVPMKHERSASYFIGELKRSGYSVSLFVSDEPDDCRTPPHDGDLWAHSCTGWQISKSWESVWESGCPILKIENTWFA